jgi:hypothetical protein
MPEQKIMKRIINLLLLLLLVSLPVQARQIGGVEIPDSLQKDGTSLVLNGAGIRTKWMMNIYVGGLYLEAAGSDAAGIVAADEPMAIRLQMVSGMITSEKMEAATREGFENTLGKNPGAMAPYIEEFIAVFREPIAEGDVFDIVHQPGKGLQVYKNGNLKSTVAGGLAFKQAVFGIWLGDKPAHAGLKKGMLGK